MDSQTDEWRRGWRTVASGGIGMAIMSGVPSVTGVVMAPLAEEFGWSRTIITSNVFICSLLTLLLAPIAGRLIARYGVRPCAIASVILAAPGLLLIALTGGSPLTWLGAWIIFGAINVGLGPLMWSTAVTGLFDRARGMALAVTLSGGGIAFLIFPPLAVVMLGTFGWRGIFVSLAAIFLFLLLPLTLAWFRGRDDVEPTASAGQATATVRALPTGFTVSQALRRRHFWQLAVLCLLVAMVEGALMIHLYPILSEGGLAPAAAAGTAALMGAALIVGRLFTGFLLDRLPAAQVFAGSIAAILVACLLAREFSGNQATGAAMALLLGLGAGGTTNALAYLTSRYFGLAGYAAIFGLLMGIFALGYGIAPVLAAHAREVLDSYMPLFAGFAVVLVVAGLLALFMGRAPRLPTPATA